MTDLKTITITMTTVEIAAITGKRHDNVLRDADIAIELVEKSRTSKLRSQITDRDTGAVEGT